MSKNSSGQRLRLHYLGIVSIILIVISVGIVFRPLLQDRLLVSDDYEHHAARLANYYLALKQDQLLPRWAPNLNDGFGYPVFNFTYHVPYLIGTYFHASGLSIQQSLNMSVLVALLVSALGTYAYGRVMKLDQLWSVVLGLSYVLNPYILLTVFWRGAVGELYAYAFIPFILTTCVLSEQVRQRKWHIMIFVVLVSSLVGLILSHLPIALVILPVLAAGLIVEGNKNRVLSYVKALCIAVLLTSWYWLPALLEQSFIAFEKTVAVSQYTTQFLPVVSLFEVLRTINSSPYFTDVIQFGMLPLIASALFVTVLFSRHHSRQRLILWYWFTVLITSLLLIDPSSKFIWDVIKPLQVIQFPWRLLVLVNLAAIIMIATSITKISRKYTTLIAVSIVAAFLYAAIGYAQTKGTATRSDYEWYQATTTASSFDEHRPILFVRTSSDIAQVSFVDSSWQSADLDEQSLQFIENTGTKMRYSVSLPSHGFLLHRRAFFPGWTAKVDGVDTAVVSSLGLHQGLVSISAEAGTHLVEVSFSDSTSARRMGMYISVFGLVLLLGILLTWRRTTEPSKKY